MINLKNSADNGNTFENVFESNLVSFNDFDFLTELSGFTNLEIEKFDNFPFIAKKLVGIKNRLVLDETNLFYAQTLGPIRWNFITQISILKVENKFNVLKLVKFKLANSTIRNSAYKFKKLRNQQNELLSVGREADSRTIISKENIITYLNMYPSDICKEAFDDGFMSDYLIVQNILFALALLIKKLLPENVEKIIPTIPSQNCMRECIHWPRSGSISFKWEEFLTISKENLGYDKFNESELNDLENYFYDLFVYKKFYYFNRGLGEKIKSKTQKQIIKEVREIKRKTKGKTKKQIQREIEKEIKKEAKRNRERKIKRETKSKVVQNCVTTISRDLEVNVYPCPKAEISITFSSYDSFGTNFNNMFPIQMDVEIRNGLKKLYKNKICVYPHKKNKEYIQERFVKKSSIITGLRCLITFLINQNRKTQFFNNTLLVFSLPFFYSAFCLGTYVQKGIWSKVYEVLTIINAFLKTYGLGRLLFHEKELLRYTSKIFIEMGPSLLSSDIMPLCINNWHESSQSLVYSKMVEKGLSEKEFYCLLSESIDSNGTSILIEGFEVQRF